MTFTDDENSVDYLSGLGVTAARTPLERRGDGSNPSAPANLDNDEGGFVELANPPPVDSNNWTNRIYYVNPELFKVYAVDKYSYKDNLAVPNDPKELYTKAVMESEEKARQLRQRAQTDFNNMLYRDAQPTSKVNHPSHYGGADNPYEAIKVIEAWGLGFSLGNAVKYISRAGKKENANIIEDLEKAAWYINREIKRLKGGL